MPVNNGTNRFSIIFVPTLFCDCTCDYCFSRNRRERVSGELLEVLLRRLEELISGSDVNHLVFYWLGGELFTLPPAFFTAFFDRFATLSQSGTVCVEHHLQSNLLHYGPQWREIIHRHFESRISSSLDYPNIYRKGPGLTPEQYNERWIERRKQAAADGIEVSVICLPNAHTVRLSPREFYLYYRDVAGVSKLQLNLPFPGENVDTPIDLDLEELGDFMEGLYEVWRDDGKPIELSPFSILERRLLQFGPNASCVFSYSCGQKLMALAPDGTVVPCDYWITHPHRIAYGSIVDSSLVDILAGQQRQRFLSRPAELFLKTECGECEFWSVCYGGCPIRSVAFNGELNTPDYYCPLYKRLFSAVLGNREKARPMRKLR
jgi:radical SAM protein with 4Fe4S-binding SPASM domain